jgi:hypothetical protein
MTPRISRIIMLSRFVALDVVVVVVWDTLVEVAVLV